MGKNITEEEIETLKQSCKQVEQNSNNLTLKQLDSVAGGAIEKFVHIANGTRTKHAGIRTISVSHNSSGEFVGYTFEHSDNTLTRALNVFLLETESKNTNNENVQLMQGESGKTFARCKRGSLVQDFIDSQTNYSAIQVNNSVYFYEADKFQQINEQSLIQAALTIHSTSNWTHSKS